MEENLNLRIDRPVCDQKSLTERFRYAQPETKNFTEVIKKRLKKSCKPSKKCILDVVLTKITIINLFRTYKLRYILKDFMSGLTVGIIQIAPS